MRVNNGYNGYNHGGWPSARLFGCSAAADWSRPATNKSISSERKGKSVLFCWERKSWKVGCWPVAAKRVGLLKVLIKRCKQKGKVFPRLTNSMVLANYKNMHLVLNMFIFTRTLVTYARTIFKPRCCLNFQSMRTWAESTYIAHNMFGQIKMEIPWYINRHTLISRKRDGKPRMIGGQFVVVRVGIH